MPAPASRSVPRKALIGFALSVALALSAAFAYRGRASSRALRRTPGANLLLVTVDTLRADAVGAYGNRRGSTPWIDRLAREGVLFRSAHAHNVVTLPSHANILTGRHPFQHGVRDNAGFRLPRETQTLATLLKSQGYRTGAFVSAFTLDSRFGLDRGFDLYDDHFADGNAAAAFVLPERSAAETVAAARRWLDAGAAPGTPPSFAWVHVYDPHAPYQPAAPFAARFAGDAYLGEVAATDAALEPLLRPLLEAGAAGRTLVVLTADHGESLGEHGERTHGVFAYEATLRVPLILYGAGMPAGREVREAAGHVDLLPTILDGLGLPTPEGLAGRSLLPLVAGESRPAAAAYFEALSAQATRGWAPLHGVASGSLKYIELPLPELYDLEADPGETRNLAARRPAELERLRAQLARLRERDDGLRRGEESRETRERLRALGYLATSAAPAKRNYGADDDPKRLIELDGMIETVLSRHRAGDVAGALALCEQVVARRPDMPASLLQLALLRRKAGRLEPALEALRQAFAIDPDDAGTAALLGAYLNEAGRARETVELLASYVERPDPEFDVLVAQGVAFAQLGRASLALDRFGRARAADPSNPMTLVQIATVHLTRGELAPARQALEQALQINPGLALAHHSLGLVAARAKQDQQALRHFSRAVDLNPTEYDALLNLGSLLISQGRPREARRYLERFVAGAPPALYAGDIARTRAWLGIHTF